MRRLAVLTAAVALLAAPSAAASPLLPPKKKVYTGVTGSTSVKNFARQVGKHPSVFGFFHKWGGPTGFIYDAAERSGSRLMLHISTQDGYGTREVITPRGIAKGDGDRYLIRTNREIAEWGRPTYVRFLAEMNQTNNGYSAFDRDGSSRGPSHSTKAFIAAWRRATLILRGGPVAAIDAELAKLKLPALHTDATDLPTPQVAMAWVPQTEGTPNIRANRARAYWPGRKYVDWVGTDFYSKFPNFTVLRRLPEQAVPVRRVGPVGKRPPGLRPPVLRVRRDAPARADAALQPGQPDRRPVPALALPQQHRRDQGGAQAEALPRDSLTRQPSMWSSTRPHACISA